MSDNEYECRDSTKFKSFQEGNQETKNIEANNSMQKQTISDKPEVQHEKLAYHAASKSRVIPRENWEPSRNRNTRDPNFSKSCIALTANNLEIQKIY